MLVLIAYASSEGSGEPARTRSLARAFTARIHDVGTVDESSDQLLRFYHY